MDSGVVSNSDPARDGCGKTLHWSSLTALHLAYPAWQGLSKCNVESQVLRLAVGTPWFVPDAGGILTWAFLSS